MGKQEDYFVFPILPFSLKPTAYSLFFIPLFAVAPFLSPIEV